jgi:DNA-binding CsgD family transcriptional regulator
MSDYKIQASLLTEREQEILRLLASGLSDGEIAEAKILTVGTVKWYNRQIYSKLGVGSRTQAVAQAQQMGLMDSGGAADRSGRVRAITCPPRSPRSSGGSANAKKSPRCCDPRAWSPSPGRPAQAKHGWRWLPVPSFYTTTMRFTSCCSPRFRTRATC